MKLFPIAFVALVAILGTIIMRTATTNMRNIAIIWGSFRIPAWVFAVVWTFIYVTYALIWSKYVRGKFANNIFALNMALNFSWTVAFAIAVSTRSQTALIISQAIIIILFLLTAYQIWYMYERLRIRERRIVTAVLGVYATWLVFATLLNFGIKV